MKQQKLKSEFQFANVLFITIAHFVHDIYTSFLAPILPLLIKKFGINYFEASLIGVFQNIPNLLNPFIGAMADRLRMRYIIIFAPAVTTIAMSLLGVAPHFVVLIVLVMIAGISSAFFHVPTPVMMKKVSGKKTGLGMSFYMIGGEAARTTGPLIVMGAVSLWGLPGTLRLAPFGLLASIILFFRFKNIPISKEIKKDEKVDGFMTTIKKYGNFFIVISGYLFFRAIMKSGLTQFLPTYLNIEKGESLWFSNIALSVLQLAAILGTFASGTISDKVGRKSTLLVIALVSPIFMWMFVHAQNDVVMFIFLILIGLFHFATGPVLLALVQDLNADRPAFVNSVYMMVAFMIASLAGLIVGYVSKSIGIQKTYEIASYVALGAIPFVLMLKGRKVQN